MTSNETTVWFPEDCLANCTGCFASHWEATQKLQVIVSTYFKIKFNFHFNIFSWLQKLKKKIEQEKETELAHSWKLLWMFSCVSFLTFEGMVYNRRFIYRAPWHPLSKMDPPLQSPASIHHSRSPEEIYKGRTLFLAQKKWHVANDLYSNYSYIWKLYSLLGCPPFPSACIGWVSLSPLWLPWEPRKEKPCIWNS